MLPQPDIAPVAGDRYRLRSDYVYEWVHMATARRMTVRAGLEYDGASVPRAARWFVERDGLQRAAALVHDALYRHQGIVSNSDVLYQYVLGDGQTYGLKVRWKRVHVDRLFGRMLREAGVPKIRRRAMYLAVRAFGAKAWRD